MMENRATGKPSESDWNGKYGEDIDTSGILFKAEDSVIHCLTNRLYAGATKDDADAVVELCSGRGKTILSGQEVGVEALIQYGVLIGETVRGPSSPNCTPQLLLKQGVCNILANVGIDGNLGVWAECDGNGNITQDGDHLLAGNVRADGSMVCAGSMQANSMVSNNPHNSVSVGAVQGPGVESQGSAVRSLNESSYSSIYQRFESETIHDEADGAAVEQVWESIGFSFRLSEEHYKTVDNFKIFETRGQQLYRALNLGETWDEPVVAAPDGTETMPYPGYEAWNDSSVYSYAEPGDAKNVDFTKGTPKARDDQSEEGLTVKTAAPADEYKVTVQETS
jgi:hypothetical protein